MLTSTGHQFGVVVRVLEIPEQDLFDGIVVETADGTRFVDADQVEVITTGYVTCNISDEESAKLPEPSGSPLYKADSTAHTGNSLRDRLGRMFGRAKWKSE